jgi:hypothetical protein
MGGECGTYGGEKECRVFVENLKKKENVEDLDEVGNI